MPFVNTHLVLELKKLKVVCVCWGGRALEELDTNTGSQQISGNVHELQQHLTQY